jgi:hypothetical protein
VLGFVLIGEALKMLFEQTLEDVDSARPIHPPCVVTEGSWRDS